jgi:hypothetical protein
VAKIASGLGLNRQRVEQAIGAGIPAILAGLTGLASKPDGARRLAGALLQQPPGMLDDIKNSLGRPAQGSVTEQGSSVLSALLGDSTVKSIASAVTDFAGLSPGGGKSVLGLLAPIVLGVLGQQQRVGGLDSEGVANLLARQKDSIAGALPPGFADQLSDTRVLDSIGDSWRDTVSDASARMSRTGHSVERMATQASSEASDAMPRWALAALAAAAIGGLLWFLNTGQQSQQVAQQSAPRGMVESNVTSTPQISVGDVSRQVASSMDGLKSTLSRITDARSATEALPTLRTTIADLDKLNGLAEKLPADGKQKIAGLVASAMPAVNDLCNKVLADPTVANVARPLIDTVRAKLGSLASV